ncbi:MAG: hypothetical protein LBF28_03315 [Rickettsiales bacterium]|jgi:hypothetical protein|nr:hypothetical protein [Rickettsiales bacterium]
MATDYLALVGLSPQMSPDWGGSSPVPSSFWYQESAATDYLVQPTALPAQTTSKEAVSTPGSKGEVSDTNSVFDSTIEWVSAHFNKDVVEGISKAATSYINGVSAYAAGMTASEQYKFSAFVKEKNADAMIANIKEIDRAAASANNALRMQGRETIANQKIAMARNGFAVNVGTNARILDKTNYIVESNMAAKTLVAELQGVELMRQAGYAKAEAGMAHAMAASSEKAAKNKYILGLVGSFAHLSSAAFSFAESFNKTPNITAGS